MNRRTFLGLLGLIGCKDINEDCMNISKKNWWLGLGSSSPESLGIIYNKSSWADLTDFTINGSTSSVASNAIEFSGGAGTFTQTLDYNRYTNLQSWTMIARVKVGTKNATSYGFGFGVRASNLTYPAAPYNMLGRFDMSTGATSGKLIVNTGQNNFQTGVSATALTFAVNDVLEISVNRSYNLALTRPENGILIRNITNPTSDLLLGGPAVLTQDVNYRFPANVGTFSIFSLGGTFTVQSLKIQSLVDSYNAFEEYKYSPLLIIGDSKVAGFNAVNNDDKFFELLKGLYGNQYLIALSGGSNGLQDWARLIPEITQLAPRKILLTGASNDKRSGRADGTISSEYDSLVTSLAAIAPVYHCTGFKETVLNQSALRTHINSTYSSDRIIDTLPETFTLDTDAVHPNATGHSQIASFIHGSGKITL